MWVPARIVKGLLYLLVLAGVAVLFFEEYSPVHDGAVLVLKTALAVLVGLLILNAQHRRHGAALSTVINRIRKIPDRRY